MEKIVESLQDVFFLGLGKNSLPFYHLVRLSRSRMIFFWRFFLELESLPSPHRNRRFESRETSNSKPDDATRTDTKWNQGWAGVSERWVWPVWPVIHDKTGYDTMSIFIIIYIYIYIYIYTCTCYMLFSLRVVQFPKRQQLHLEDLILFRMVLDW